MRLRFQYLITCTTYLNTENTLFFYHTVCSRVSYDVMNKQGLAPLSLTGLCHAEAVCFCEVKA